MVNNLVRIYVYHFFNASTLTLIKERQPTQRGCYGGSMQRKTGKQVVHLELALNYRYQ